MTYKLPFLPLLILALGFSSAFAQPLSVTHLTCEHLTNPLGIDDMHPQLSWQIQSDRNHTLQTACQIRVADNLDNLQKGRKLMWDSGKMMSDASLHSPYQGAVPNPGQRCYWQVRIWDNHGRTSSWSEPAWWEAGLIDSTRWQAQWISQPWTEDPGISQPSPLLRKTFAAGKRIVRARLYVSSHGLYEAYLNGKRIGDEVFTPGWTSYNHRLEYQTYDVTDLVQSGQNAVGVVLGDGWYRGNIGWVSRRNHYGKELGLLARLEVEYANGGKDIIVSDESWKASTGPILMSDIYHGESYDARLEKKGWLSPEYDDHDWDQVKLSNRSMSVLRARESVPVRRMEMIPPVAIFTTPQGDTVVDFGQNLVGWVKLKVTGPAGQTIRIDHAEVLDKDGNFYNENFRAAQAKLEYTLNGTGMETYEPHFTFMGFRYARIRNWPGHLSPSSLTAVVVHSDMRPTGNFTCSDTLVNQLQHNIRWGQKGNFLDVPTDCPQRDERLGWTGDAQAFSRTAAFNFDVSTFFLKWLADVSTDQREDGAVPFVIPHVLGKNDVASTGWADAATIIPWNMYLAYGDPQFLSRQYESMKKWVGYMESKTGPDMLWNKGFHFGDWLFFRPFDDNDGRSAVTDKYLIAQSFFIHSVDIMRKSAAVLGKETDRQYYDALAEKLREAYRKEYLTPNGRLVSGTQTAYVLALAFDLLPVGLRRQAAERLVDNIRSYGHITTGFLGTPYICHVLSEYGYTELAYELLFRKEYPSWLYPVTRGATTIWERWDGIKPDGTFQTPGMNSFNHYAYGAIGDWLYRRVAGIDIDPEQPGYQHILLHPEPTDSLQFARASYESPYGLIESGWKRENGISYDIQIPPNTTATVRFKENDPALKPGNGILSVKRDEEGMVLELGSGSYRFNF